MYLSISQHIATTSTSMRGFDLDLLFELGAFTLRWWAASCICGAHAIKFVLQLTFCQGDVLVGRKKNIGYCD